MIFQNSPCSYKHKLLVQEDSSLHPAICRKDKTTELGRSDLIAMTASYLKERHFCSAQCHLSGFLNEQFWSIFMFLTPVTWNHFHCTQGITRQTQTNNSRILSLWRFLRNSTDLQMMILILPKRNQKYCLGREENKKDIIDIPIQYKDKDSMDCQQLDSFLHFFLLNSHLLPSRTAEKQLLASEVISVIKAN